MPTAYCSIILAEEDIFVWGQNNFGQLGTGDTQQRQVPEKITSLSPHQIVDLSSGYRHTLAATTEGAVYSWGHNGNGQLGQGVGDKTNRHSPTKIPSLSHSKVVQVSSGEDFSLVLTSEGRIFSFGDNNGGQLGQGVLI